MPMAIYNAPLSFKCGINPKAISPIAGLAKNNSTKKAAPISATIESIRISI